jgi:hypothetical protein
MIEPQAVSRIYRLTGFLATRGGLICLQNISPCGQAARQPRILQATETRCLSAMRTRGNGSFKPSRAAPPRSRDGASAWRC